MSAITDAVAEAAKRLCGEDLNPGRAYVVFRTMGHRRSIPFKAYPQIEAMRKDDPVRFDELVRKTVGVMKHYRWSYQTFLKALWYHDPKRKVVRQ